MSVKIATAPAGASPRLTVLFDGVCGGFEREVDRFLHQNPLHHKFFEDGNVVQNRGNGKRGEAHDHADGNYGQRGVEA